MDYQKPVKVKSRWTQSSQMEMMMEESQSSLDMSDAITDISTSDLNESTDYNSELNYVELRRSCQTISNDINILDAVKNININEPLVEVKSLSTKNLQLCKDDKFNCKENTTYSNTIQKSHSDIDVFNLKDVHEQFNNKLNVIKLKQTNSDKLNISIDQSKEDKPYQISCLPKSIEQKNVLFSSIYKSKRTRSKSLDSVIMKTNNNIKRCISYDEINKLDIVVTCVDGYKITQPKKNPTKEKRRQSKRIKYKNNDKELPDDIKVPVVNYDQEADEIFKEHKNQLIKARINDKDFDERLKSTNFTLINENIYRPNRQTLKSCPPSDISALRKLKQRVISGDINDYCECTLTKEDIMEGSIGCDDSCLNRVLKVECGLGCSLKQHCTNKQFQNKQFKKTNIIKTEKKGYGICAIEDIPKGFLIGEFVGEVIDYNEMCNRLEKKEYEDLNYMIQLNADEIIDSTLKGNVTRFINHSCDPNAVGEKWHVLGQSRIGFFSTRHIKQGEEITFDYSFQRFGNDKQPCYCGSSKCRGYIGKAPQGFSNSEDDGDSTIENNFVAKANSQQRKKKSKKNIVYNDKNKLRELSRQLTEVAKLKTGCKADQEMATLNLNRLMVHITDSVSRLHVLRFIQEHDMNKRLFMDFSGLSIIHNWMTSNENESFKLMILEILDELPIMNRNTITKSKVLDVVAEWAKIPQDVKIKIESLEYPATELQKHYKEIDNILSRINEEVETMNDLVNKARSLWKKWIVLKIVFKIPKKIDQHKTIEETHRKKPPKYSNLSPMDITVLDQKPYRISNKYRHKVKGQQTVSLERMKLRKEYELKMEQDRQQTFRKNVMNNWFEHRNRVVKKKQYQRYFPKQTSNYLNRDNFILNQNNKTVKQSRWDCSSQVTYNGQNSMPNNNLQQTPCSDSTSSLSLQQQSIQFQQYPCMASQIIPNYPLVNQPTFFNSPPLPLPNKLFVTKSQIPSTSLNNRPLNQNVKPPSPTRHLLKSADSNVFNLINNSLRKHYNQNQNTEMEHSNKLCSRTVQSGADLLARIKVISDSFKKQPSKLINIKHLKQRNDDFKQEKAPLSNTILKSVCNKNKRITFINEQEGVSSNILNEDVMPIPKNIPLSGNNKFANAILNSLMKNSTLEKENYVPNKFVLTNLNSEIITCDEIDKEIELYKNMKPKIIKKVVAHIKTKNGFTAVMKRQWGVELKGLKKKCDKIPATQHNIRNGKLKNCLVNTTKSVLKKRSSNDVNDLKRPKEKRVSFLIDGKTSPIYPDSEVQPLNLYENTLIQKPLMKCHPLIRKEIKSILQSSTSVIQNDNLELEQSFETTNDQIIAPIVTKFKSSRSRRISLRDKSAVLEQLRCQRTHMIPVSMMSLSVDVLKLIPDNKKEMRKVIDYYHAMATVIVKTLGSYAKKTCLQGRIRSDEDFKYLAKKINENVLLKELQLKKVDKLKISNSTKDKVAEYIRKYMSRFGEVYKRKFNGMHAVRQ